MADAASDTAPGADVRAVFLAAVDAAGSLYHLPALADRWAAESALPHFAVSGLAGHLLRAVTSVEAYLDRPEPPAGGAITPAAYYATATAEQDVGAEIHRMIRARGEEAAAAGPGGLAEAWAAARVRLSARLAEEPAVRHVRVYGDMVLSLDDYLLTRLVELCVHADDLALSLGVDPPEFPAEATRRAIATLVDVGRFRHGDAAVVRALARRERDAAAALRVL